MQDDFDIETKVEEQKKNPGSSELGGKKLMKMYINSLPIQFDTILTLLFFSTEPSLVCEEDEIMRSKESPDLSISHSQV